MVVENGEFGDHMAPQWPHGHAEAQFNWLLVYSTIKPSPWSQLRSVLYHA